MLAGGINDVSETFKISAAEAGLIGDVFRPFASLPELAVGQSWRMQVVNPVSVITGIGSRFMPLLVQVTGRETINAPDGRQVECFIVEAPSVRAWVDREGLVWVQQVELPVGGQITLRNEPHDADEKVRIEEQFNRSGDGRNGSSREIG